MSSFGEIPFDLPFGKERLNALTGVGTVAKPDEIGLYDVVVSCIDVLVGIGSERDVDALEIESFASEKLEDRCLIGYVIFRRISAWPSLRAWLVFSTARLFPISFHRPVTESCSRKWPGGSCPRMALTIPLDILILSFVLQVTYLG